MSMKYYRKIKVGDEVEVKLGSSDPFLAKINKICEGWRKESAPYPLTEDTPFSRTINVVDVKCIVEHLGPSPFDKGREYTASVKVYHSTGVIPIYGDEEEE